MSSLFYDSVAPAKIPIGTSACLYYDGDYAATQDDASRFQRVRWITVEGDYEHCGIADYEAGNEVFSEEGELEVWVKGRIAMGKRARVYCDRDNLPEVRELLGDLDYLVWVSTLDGDPLTASWTEGLWAVQYRGGASAEFDTSVLYGEW
jgi:hypothetical protein